jgi:hypothetical protein
MEEESSGVHPDGITRCVRRNTWCELHRHQSTVQARQGTGPTITSEHAQLNERLRLIDVTAVR